MPSMSGRHYAFICSMIESVDDFQKQFMTLSSEIRNLEVSWAEAGLVRGLHYTMTPITRTEFEAICNNRDLRFPCRMPLCDIRFRNRQAFQAIKYTLHEADGSTDQD
jgi:hypothetical protein